MENEYLIGIPIGAFVLICIYLFGTKEMSDRAYRLLSSIFPWFKHAPPSPPTPDGPYDCPTTCLELQDGTTPDMDCCKLECKPGGLVNAAVYCKKELCNDSNINEENKSNL